MLNPIHAIKQLYQLDSDTQSLTTYGIDPKIVEQQEADLGIQLPAMLYHYLLELGNIKAINESYHKFVQLPFEWLGEYLVIGKTCDDDGVWGIHQDDLGQHNPIVRMSRNFDAIEQSEVHWFDELPLAEFLLAMAIINGLNGGFAYHAQIYDFAGNTIPSDLGGKLENFAPAIQEISELNRAHERYFEIENFGGAMVLNLDEGKPTAFLVGSQNQAVFETWINTLAL